MTSCLISDDKLTIILAVVIPITLLAVVAGVVAFCMWKKKKDKGQYLTQENQWWANLISNFY